MGLDARNGYRRPDDGADEIPMQPLWMAADPRSLAQVRQALRRWLTSLAWPAEQVSDVLLAVNEALTNCVEHAYLGIPGNGRKASLQVEGGVRVDRSSRVRRVWLTVSDTGRWRPERAREASFGLQLMRSCMESVKVRRTERGTHVTLLSRAVANSA